MNRPITCAAIAWLTLVGSGHGWSQTTQPPPSTAAQLIAGTTSVDGWYTLNRTAIWRTRNTPKPIRSRRKTLGKLQKVWEVHTGDVSDGSGKIPLTDWSATPLFVNDTVYVSTPFYRIFGDRARYRQDQWTYDTHSVLQAVTQPDLKTRGVAYWQAAAPQPGALCQKIVYIGTMDAKLPRRRRRQRQKM